jgi:hypothetical protein
MTNPYQIEGPALNLSTRSIRSCCDPAVSQGGAATHGLARGFPRTLSRPDSPAAPKYALHDQQIRHAISAS